MQDSGTLYPEIVIAGCGNPLFADDGFGPAVIEELHKFDLPENAKAVDAGTSGPILLFPLLNPAVTRRLIVIDTMDFGAEPGSIVLLNADDIDGIRDNHPAGIAEILYKIGSRVEITIIGCQPGCVSYPRLKIGLSDEVQKAVFRTVHILLNCIRDNYITHSLCSWEGPLIVEQPSRCS